MLFAKSRRPSALAALKTVSKTVLVALFATLVGLSAMTLTGGQAQGQEYIAGRGDLEKQVVGYQLAGTTSQQSWNESNLTVNGGWVYCGDITVGDPPNGESLTCVPINEYYGGSDAVVQMALAQDYIWNHTDLNVGQKYFMTQVLLWDCQDKWQEEKTGSKVLDWAYVAHSGPYAIGEQEEYDLKIQCWNYIGAFEDSYIGTGWVYLGHDGQQPLMEISLEPKQGQISVEKRSSDATVTASNSIYSDMSGFKFGVYTDEGCQQSACDPLVTSADGKAVSSMLPVGTYYVKELPSGKNYEVRSDVFTVTVAGGETAVVQDGDVGYVVDDFDSVEVEAMLIKQDSDGQTGAQGDATLEGARFLVEYFDNMQGDTSGTPLHSWTLQTDEDGVARLDGDHLVSGDSIPKDSAGKPCLVKGTYRLTETIAPEGYKLSSDANTVVVDGQPGEISAYNAPTISETVIRGGVKIVKQDLELAKSESIGGKDHVSQGFDGASLAGVQFTLTNSSRAEIMVDGKAKAPGDEVCKLTVAWNEEDGAYTAQTASDYLPYGTYTLTETATNGSYLLTDGAPRTFKIQSDGVVVDVSTDGSQLAWSDQVVRNDLRFLKKDDATSKLLSGVPFAITNVSTGETHVAVTDMNGMLDTSTAFAGHTSSTNANDGLLELETISTSDIVSSAGIWFGMGEDGSISTPDDALGALPYGKYTIQELRCPSNEGLELWSDVFYVGYDSSTGSKIDLGTIDDQPGPAISTIAHDSSSMTQEGQVGQNVTIVDTIYYRNLEAGETYTFSGMMVDRATGDVLEVGGEPVEASNTVKVSQETGVADVSFTLDSMALDGEDTVIFEKAIDEDGNVVATHEDLEAGSQTIGFGHTPSTPSSNTKGGLPKTGDESSMYLVAIAVLCISAIAMGALVTIRMRRKWSGVHAQDFQAGKTRDHRR